jgi:hypothetical protein
VYRLRGAISAANHMTVPAVATSSRPQRDLGLTGPFIYIQVRTCTSLQSNHHRVALTMTIVACNDI